MPFVRRSKVEVAIVVERDELDPDEFRVFFEDPGTRARSMELARGRIDADPDAPLGAWSWEHEPPAWLGVASEITDHVSQAVLESLSGGPDEVPSYVALWGERVMGYGATESEAMDAGEAALAAEGRSVDEMGVDLDVADYDPEAHGAAMARPYPAAPST
jgi:hypothetical protein